MASVAIWQVGGEEPSRLLPSSVNLEAELEAWINRVPDLVQFGLLILGRQVRVEAGPIDLLALDPQGRWCVIEIKREAVDRATIGQVLDYAACLQEMTEENLRLVLEPHLRDRALNLEEELRKRDAIDSLTPGNRQIVSFLVGTSRGVGLERTVRYLSEGYEVPIHATLFSVFQTSEGGQVLVRETAEGEAPPVATGRWQSATPQQIREHAAAAGLGEVYDIIAGAAAKHGLSARPWKRAVMFTPPTDGRRCLFSLWTTPREGKLKFYTDPRVFAEFLPVTEAQAMEVLGGTWDRMIGIDDARDFARRLDTLLASQVRSSVSDAPGPDAKVSPTPR